MEGEGGGGHSPTLANRNGEEDTPMQSQRIISIKKNGPSIATGEKRRVTEKKSLADFSGPQ